ncbi:MAG: hypothetical protein A4E69_01878 [Syntrophus sp. PtaB.Bin138]|nr:MAG: hypothetical protein A4E69_01878 [Syntrophus sp. PtaB.Bin138]
MSAEEKTNVENQKSGNQIVPFIYDESPVRVVLDESSAPWFVAKDVCSILEISDHRQAIEILDDDERGGYKVPTPGGPQEATCINEPGLYTLIFRSNKPNAKAFRRWVTHEVLPTLRRTGQYAVNENVIAETQAMAKEFAQLASSIVNVVDRLDHRLAALEEKENHLKIDDHSNVSDNLAESFFIKHLNQVVKIRPDVRNFLIEKTIIHPDAGTLLSWMYLMYEQWCYANCHIPIGKIHFYNECRTALAGYGEVKASRGNKLYVTGIRLRDDKDF